MAERKYRVFETRNSEEEIVYFRVADWTDKEARTPTWEGRRPYLAEFPVRGMDVKLQNAFANKLCDAVNKYLEERNKVLEKISL